VEAGSSTSTIALRFVECDEKGNRCLRVKLGHPVPGGHKYRDLVFQVGGLYARLTTLLCKKIIVAKLKEVNLLTKAMAQKGLFCQ
jgi:hypothetical protein